MSQKKAPSLRRRKNRAKEARLQKATLDRVIARKRRHMRADAPLVALRMERDEEIVIGVRRGLFGHPGTVILRVDDASLVGIAEDNAELAKFVNNVGLLAVAQLFGHNLAEGLAGLGRRVAEWAGIDLEALKREAEADTDAPPPAAEPVVIEVPSVVDTEIGPVL